MDGCKDVLALAALLERAYRLALAVQDDLLPGATVSSPAANELVEVLDDARVLLLPAARPQKVADLLSAAIAPAAPMGCRYPRSMRKRRKRTPSP